METFNLYEAIIVVAEQMLADEISILTGVRQLVALGSQVEIYEDERFLIFRAIDSEVDHLPIGQRRKHWNKEVLKTKDEEIREYEADVRDETLKACRELIDTLKHKTNGNQQ